MTGDEETNNAAYLSSMTASELRNVYNRIIKENERTASTSDEMIETLLPYFNVYELFIKIYENSFISGIRSDIIGAPEINPNSKYNPKISGNISSDEIPPIEKISWPINNMGFHRAIMPNMAIATGISKFGYFTTAHQL